MSVTMVDHVSAISEPEEIVKFLRKNMQYRDISRRVLYQRIVEQTARDRKVEVTPEEIQAEADQFRRQHRLERASDTLAWLAEQHMTPDDWESGVFDRLLLQKLMETLFSQDVERVFAENRLNYDRLSLYQIVLADEKLAQEIFYQIEEAEISFFEAAHLYDVDEARRLRCGYEGTPYRFALHPEMAAIVFSGTPGQVLGPLVTEQGHHILMVEKFLPAELTPELREELLSQLFQEWLDGELNYMIHNQ